MVWSKGNLQKGVENAYNKSDVLRNLGKNQNSYKTLDKYLKLYDIDISHLKPRCIVYKWNNYDKIYSKGDKHPTKNLYFWQYRPERKGSNSYEVWFNEEDYNRANKMHRVHNHSYTRKDILATITRTALTRVNTTKSKFLETKEEKVITIEYIKLLWEKQEGKCYWLNIPMSLKMSEDGITNLDKVSIDRLDNKKTYIQGNVVLCTNFANRGRGNADIKTMIEFLKSAKLGI